MQHKFWNVYLLALQSAFTHLNINLYYTHNQFWYIFCQYIYKTQLHLLQFSQINILLYMNSFIMISNFMSSVMTKWLHYLIKQ